MSGLGHYNDFTILRFLEFGALLDGGEWGELKLAKRCIPDGAKAGDTVRVFLYTDSEDQPAVTTDAPLCEVGDFALLECLEVNNYGAFLDWGIPKDLMVPFREQKQKMETGRQYMVYVYVDESSKRIVASSKIERFLDQTFPRFEEGQEVKIKICGQNDLGYKAIIEGTHSGILYRNEIFRKLRIGEESTAFVKKVREDDKIDLILDRPGPKKVDALSQKILDTLADRGGFINVTDKSDPEFISMLFGVSKKTYKKAAGALYKARMIRIEDDGIYLNSETRSGSKK